MLSIKMLLCKMEKHSVSSFFLFFFFYYWHGKRMSYVIDEFGRQKRTCSALSSLQSLSGGCLFAGYLCLGLPFVIQ